MGIKNILYVVVHQETVVKFVLFEIFNQLKAVLVLHGPAFYNGGDKF